MKQSLHSRKENAAVLVIDTLELRRAAVVSLLTPWADSNGMAIAEIDPHRALSQQNASCQNANSLKMLVLVMGAQGVSDPEPQNWIRSLCTMYANVPIVLVSDREETREVVAAFEAGVRGFIPTNIATPVAIQTFTFIMRGGSFFPPIALMEPLRNNRAPQIGAGKDVVVIAAQHKGGLTVRQQEVLAHLQRGSSNKLIGRQLKLRESTVKVHIRQIMRKLGATNRTQAALCAAQFGLSSSVSEGGEADKGGAIIQEAASQMLSPSPGPADTADRISTPRIATHAGSFQLRVGREQALRQEAYRSTSKR